MNGEKNRNRPVINFFLLFELFCTNYSISHGCGVRIFVCNPIDALAKWTAIQITSTQQQLTSHIQRILCELHRCYVAAVLTSSHRHTHMNSNNVCNGRLCVVFCSSRERKPVIKSTLCLYYYYDDNYYIARPLTDSLEFIYSNCSHLKSPFYWWCSAKSFRL